VTKLIVCVILYMFDCSSWSTIIIKNVVVVISIISIIISIIINSDDSDSDNYFCRYPYFCRS